MEYGSRLHRFVAFVIDFVILIVIWGILSGIGIISINVSGDTEEANTASSVIQAAVAFSYFFLFTAFLGATLGKMAMGLKVVDAEGNQAGMGSVAVRELIVRSAPSSASSSSGER